ncbi:MATE family efflux transporter [Helicobacter ailurogastricus]|uniref:MATE family efflux transporter n=1 Tax=Helicobacter ailurogastricus TaxID=1578720 RepID=UPI000AEA093F|nr:MATE family efflux transporter [Helicobacter ailurogastricus]BDQ28735.1 MATE family efflux transporter [Helicobacter ailurogastricus]
MNNFLEIFVVAVSVVFMGKLSDNHIVAMGVGLQYIMLFYALNSIFYIGTNATLSRLVGAKDTELVAIGYSSILIGACGLCAVAGVVGFLGIDSFVAWMGIEGTASDLAKKYLQILIWAMPAVFIKNTMASALASLSDTLTPFVLKILMSGLCLFLNDALIFGHFGFARLGIKGAALAGVAVAFLELMLLFLAITLKKNPLKFRLVFDGNLFKKAWQVGWPSGFERLLTLFSMALVSKFVASYGNEVLAGMQVGLRIETFSYMPGLGFTIACMVLVGQHLGANQVNRAQEYIRTILKVAGVLLGVLGVCMLIFAKPLATIFSSNARVVQVASWYLMAVGLSQMPLICLFVLDGAFRGAGMAKFSLFINTCSLWSLRILPMFVLWRLGASVRWFFVLICFETFARAGFFYIAYKKGIWKKPGRFAT